MEISYEIGMGPYSTRSLSVVQHFDSNQQSLKDSTPMEGLCDGLQEANQHAP